MLSVIAIIVLIFMIISIVFCCIVDSDEAKFGWGWGIGVSALVLIGLIIALICGGEALATQTKIDAEIEMYAEENAKIEIVITETVEKYLQHEYEIYDSLQGEDIQTLLVVYPEINSNELVKHQIDVFIENNSIIKELKSEKINLATWKFLLYFGR